MNGLRRRVFTGFVCIVSCVLFLAAPAWSQTQGEWAGTTDEGGRVYFAVGGGTVQNFEMLICLSGGSGGFGCFEMFMGSALSISGGSFAYAGPPFELTGTFTGATTCSGTWRYRDGYLGYGGGTWSAGFGAPPVLDLSPSNHKFLDQAIHTAGSPVSFYLNNIGGGLATGSISLSGADADQFEITGGGGNFSLPHSQSRQISVRFKPTTPGAKTAALTVDGNPPCKDISGVITGTATNPILTVVPTSRDVPATGGSEAFKVSNGGTGVLNWSAAVDPSSTWLSIAGKNSGTGSGTIPVAYEPNYGTEARLGSFTVTAAGAANSPQTIEVRQSDGVPSLVFSPASHDFGKIMAFASSDTIEIALTNQGGGIATGSASLTGLNAGEFEITGGGGSFTLAHNDSKTLSVRFRPATLGSKTAALTATLNSSGTAFSAALSANGTRPEWEFLSSDIGDEDLFGFSSAIDGDYAIVGGRADSSGSAYIFERSGDVWVHRARLTTSGGGYFSSLYGWSVDISGDVAIVGARWDDGKGASAGVAYIFEKPKGGWTDMTETVKLIASDAEKGERFGKSVDISGNYAIVLSVGATYVYYVKNFPPSLSDIKDQLLNDRMSTGPLDLVVVDSETPAGELALASATSNSTLVPNDGIVIGGTGSNRTLTVTPAPGLSGTATISVTVSDGEDTAVDTFTVSVPDTDGDGLPDNLETGACTDAGTSDTDKDGIADGVEDGDHDGEVDSDETDPCRWDTDGDGLSDGLEDANKNGLVDPGETDPLKRDSDGDGLGDGEEDRNRNGARDSGETDPCDRDTDGDDCGDQDERLAGSDPLSDKSVPCIVCIDPAGVCEDCTGDFQCYLSIQEGIDYAVSQSNPASLIKVFKGDYEEPLILPEHINAVAHSGPVTLKPH